MCEHVCSGAPEGQKEELDVGTGIAGGCELPMWVLGTELLINMYACGAIKSNFFLTRNCCGTFSAH